MRTFTVWQFDSSEGAESALDELKRLQRHELIELNDAALVAWPEGAKKPKTRQLHSVAGAGALGGSFWGLLFGLLFFAPILGLALGAAGGAIAGSLTDVGIDDTFIKQVREKVQPGTSALFLLTSHGVVDKLAEELTQVRGHATLTHSNLTEEQEKLLRETFEE
jgi:uncharacterized membrane protein